MQLIYKIVTEFLDSWSLFSEMYLAGWLIAAILALAGVLVVARNQVFLGAAVAQASTLGVAIALLLETLLDVEHGTWTHGLLTPSVFAVSFAVLAALLCQGSREPGRESNEAITGWIFLFSSSASVMVVAKSPHGLDEVQKLIASSILGATAADVVLFASTFAVVTVLLLLTWRRLLLLIVDPQMATAVGMSVRVWSTAMSIGLGLAIGLSLRASGLIYTFGCLVLPALCAKNLCREVRSMFWLAPAIAVGAALIGFMVANHYDYPPTQATVVLLSLLLLCVWIQARFRK